MARQTSIPLYQLPVGEANSTVSLSADVLNLLKAYKNAHDQGDYQEIRNLSSQFYGLATDILHRIELITYYSIRERKLGDKEDADLSKAMKELGEDNSAEGQEIKSAMLAKFQESLSPDDAQKALDSLLDGSHALFDQALLRSKNADNETDFLCNDYISMLTFAVLTDYLGYFRVGLAANPFFKKNILPEDTKLVNELSETLKTMCNQGYSEIYEALKANNNVDSMLGIVEIHQRKLQRMFGITGSLLGPYLFILSNSDEDESHNDCYNSALDLTENINRASVLFAYLCYLRGNLSDRNLNRWYGNERRRTDKRSFTSNIPQGTVTSLHDIKENDSIPEGHMVQVSGIVTSIEILEDENSSKFSTIVVLKELETDNSIQLRAHMFGLTDNGVAVGSYMRVNAFVRRDEPWIEGSTGLDIDRIGLKSLARDNWLDDVIERMKEYFPLHQDGMNMFFTLN